jgi:hypothetical protein
MNAAVRAFPNDWNYWNLWNDWNNWGRSSSDLLLTHDGQLATAARSVGFTVVGVS